MLLESMLEKFEGLTAEEVLAILEGYDRLDCEYDEDDVEYGESIRVIDCYGDRFYLVFEDGVYYDCYDEDFDDWG